MQRCYAAIERSLLLRAYRAHKASNDCEHYAKQWELLADSSKSVEAEAKLLADHGDTYQPPLKPWVRALAGQQFVFRSRTPDNQPDLMAELLFISDVMYVLCLPPALKDMLFSPEQLELLTALQSQCPSGPWETLLSTQAKVRSSLPATSCLTDLLLSAGQWRRRRSARPRGASFLHSPDLGVRPQPAHGPPAAGVLGHHGLRQRQRRSRRAPEETGERAAPYAAAAAARRHASSEGPPDEKLFHQAVCGGAHVPRPCRRA